jgi:hypothetical protein
LTRSKQFLEKILDILFLLRPQSTFVKGDRNAQKEQETDPQHRDPPDPRGAFPQGSGRWRDGGQQQLHHRLQRLHRRLYGVHREVHGLRLLAIRDMK